MTRDPVADRSGHCRRRNGRRRIRHWGSKGLGREQVPASPCLIICKIDLECLKSLPWLPFDLKAPCLRTNTFLYSTSSSRFSIAIIKSIISLKKGLACPQCRSLHFDCALAAEETRWYNHEKLADRQPTSHVAGF